VRPTDRFSTSLLGVALLTSAAAAQPGFTIVGALPGGAFSAARAASLNGDWIAGHGTSILAWPGEEAFRWSLGTGIQSLGPYGPVSEYGSYAYGVSNDGSVVVGTISTSLAMRWTPATGKESLGSYPGYTRSSAQAVSADGSVIVGWALDAGSVAYGMYWTEASAWQLVPGMSRSRAYAVSADGSIIVGDGRPIGQSVDSAFRWTIGTAAPEFTGPFPGTTSRTHGLGASPDGRIVVGIADIAALWRAFAWTQEYGYMLLAPPPNGPSGGYRLCEAYAVSLDGTLIGGRCVIGTTNALIAVIWTAPGPQGPYQPQVFSDYLAQRGVEVHTNVPRIFNINSISADGRVLVGTSGWGPAGSRAYRVEFCYANCDASTTAPFLNVEDFTCFINRFAAAHALPPEVQRWHYANCDRSSTPPVLNVEDFTCFITKFAAGCPSP
jgi:uncharacterized membrane protein